MIYGYIRVSTEKQTLENQRFEICKYCQENGMVIDKWIEETISGTKSPDKRRLGHLLDRLGENDLIIATEISRFGRSLFMVMEILNLCLEKGCKVRTLRDNYYLGDDIQSKVLAFAFGLSAEIERTFISQRTKEALERKRKEGVILGRPKGSTSSKRKLDGSEDRIVSLLRKGKSRTAIAKRLGVHRSTLSNYIADKRLLEIAGMDNIRPSVYYSLLESQNKR